MGKRGWNHRTRELHEALDDPAVALGHEWLDNVCTELDNEAHAIPAILVRRVQAFPPTASQHELAKELGITRDRLRVIESWLIRRIRGRLRYELNGCQFPPHKKPARKNRRGRKSDDVHRKSSVKRAREHGSGGDAVRGSVSGGAQGDAAG